MRKTSVTDGGTDGRTECKPIVPPGFTGGGLIKHINVNIYVDFNDDLYNLAVTCSYKG